MNVRTEARAERRLVLHVEDDGDHAELVSRCLSKHCPESRIHRVEDGEAAIEYLDKAHDAGTPRPYLILLDLRLPKMDGIAVLQKVRTTPHLSSIPVVILTTSGNESDLGLAYTNHANSYLVKPDDFGVLDSMLKDLGEYWLDWNVQPVGAY
jgi:CheY-like chemotaxis protein